MEFKIDTADVSAVSGLVGSRLFMHQRRKAAIITLVSKHVPAGGSILDVGCASGDIAIELAFKGYRVHGIDFEPARLKRARELAEKFASFAGSERGRAIFKKHNYRADLPE